MNDEYRTIKSKAEGIFKDRGSKFLSKAYSVETEDDITGIIGDLRKEYRDARHHCYAYKLGMTDNNWRANDDGEPSGTAGKPILGQIHSFDLTNILIVVIRYFGGTLLGTGGLINAYREAARDALTNAEIVVRTENVSYRLEFPYDKMNDVMRLIKEESLMQSDQVFELNCSLIITFRKSQEKRIIARLERLDEVTVMG
jgi:uncharacterized YigZ family protein